jgi:NADH dehydrogenase [ubiquinone] 1 alpha subcomplex assembly factor 7
VEAAIRGAIAAEGPITFERLMEIALYGPGGFYDSPRVGASGDFVTSPHVHPVFARLLAHGIEELRTLCGDPAPLRLTEVGAGDGTLARQLLEHLTDVDYTAVERSADARDALGTVEGVTVTERLDAPGPHVLLANELLDNLPFRVVREGHEARIALGDDRLIEVLAPAGDDLAKEPDGVVPTGALGFVDTLAEHLDGYALLIDYVGGEVHGYRSHAVVADVLASPGDTDITAGIDIARLSARAQERGLTVFPDVSQQDALRALGYEAWYRTELERQHRALDDRDGVAAVRTWSGRSQASLLVDPGALGRFRWLVLASDPALPAPSFIRPPA